MSHSDDKFYFLVSKKMSPVNNKLHPIVWNSLPSFVCTADSFTSFRSQLKTYVRKTFVAGPLSATYQVFYAL